MAGRGRAATLPAWMMNDPNAAQAALASQPSYAAAAPALGAGTKHITYMPPGQPQQFADAAPRQPTYGSAPPPGAYGAPDRGGGMDRGMDRRRDRSPDRRGGASGGYGARDRGGYDRGGGGGGHGGGGGNREPQYGQSSRRNRRERSTSRDRERREERRRRRKERGSNFDVLPEGMDEATANQIAAQAFLQQTLPAAAAAAAVPLPMGGGAAPTMQQTRHARRLYVGNIPRVPEQEVQRFFNEVLTRALGGRQESDPVVSVYLNQDRGFAFVELRSVALTTAAIQLDGLMYGDISLKIRRPSDYNPSAVPSEFTNEVVHLNLSALGIVSNTVPDSPNKVFIGGLPYHLTEEQVKELLSAFGALKALHLVKDAGATNSKGYAFCEYQDPAVTSIACEGLNGMALGDKTLTVRKANVAEAQGGAFPYAMDASAVPAGISAAAPSAAEALMLAQAMAALDPTAHKAVTESAEAATVVRTMAPTRVLVLMNMVGEEDLKDDQEYTDILEDVRDECKQYGELKTVIIPRPGETGVGKVFLEYAEVQQAQAAAMALAGRQFASKIVKAQYHDESRFAARDLA